MWKFLTILFFCLQSLLLQAQAQPFSKAAPLYRKAQQLLQQGMFLEAVTVLKKSIAADKKFDSSHIALAELYLRISQNDSAVKVLNAALKNKPAFTKAHELMGKVYRDYIKNSTTAITHYTNAAKYDSTNKETWYSLAWCSNDLKKYSDAVKYAIKALDIDNSYKPAYNEMGHAFRNMGTFKEALEVFRQRLNISVNEQPLYYSGLCYIELKDKEGAQKIYDELVKIQSKAADILKKRIDTMQ
jgi:tetratricopeptide (TPR) repeat protein